MATEGFFVPGSRTASYVKGKTNEYGASDYYSNVNELGIQKQAALQNLSDQYASTINNAYAAYLANQRNIMTSAMGQGFKEQYLQNQQQQLAAQQAQAAQNLATSRAELEQQASTSKSTLDELYTRQTKNLDRIVNSMGDYLTYVKSLTGLSADKQTELKALTEEQEQMSLDELYGTLYNLDPKNLVDEEGVQGKRYSDWIKGQIKGTDEDTDWYNWLMYEGGLQDYKAMLDKTEAVQRPLKEKQIADDLASYKEIVSKTEFPEGTPEEVKAEYKGSDEERLKYYKDIVEKQQHTKEYVGHAERQEKGGQYWYNFNGKSYLKDSNPEIRFGVGGKADTKLGKELTKKLDLTNKIKDGKLAEGDVISHEGNLYILEKIGKNNYMLTALLNAAEASENMKKAGYKRKRDIWTDKWYWTK